MSERLLCPSMMCANYGHLADEVRLVNKADNGRSDEQACYNLSDNLRGVELTRNDSECLCGKQDQGNINNKTKTFHNSLQKSLKNVRNNHRSYL